MSFLIIYSYYLLCDLSYYKQEYVLIPDEPYNETFDLNNTDATNNSVSFKSVLEDRVIQSPTYLEILLIIWIISFICEEIRQVIKF